MCNCREQSGIPGMTKITATSECEALHVPLAALCKHCNARQEPFTVPVVCMRVGGAEEWSHLPVLLLLFKWPANYTSPGRRLHLTRESETLDYLWTWGCDYTRLDLRGGRKWNHITTLRLTSRTVRRNKEVTSLNLCLCVWVCTHIGLHCIPYMGLISSFPMHRALFLVSWVQHRSKFCLPGV